MKFLICALCLLGPLYAFSQGNAPAEVRRYLKPASAPAFKSLADTLSPTLYISKAEKLVEVDGSQGKWVKVRRGNADLFVSARFFEPLTDEAAGSNQIRTVGPAVYAVAKTSKVLAGRGRLLMLDEGVKRKLKDTYYADANGVLVQFETEAAVLNFLDSLGWSITPNGQEMLTPAGLDVRTGLSKPYEFDNVYILKRKSAGTK
jgi:hypothetical protein